MINLLPPELKDSYHYAHRNVRLVRWALSCALSFIGLAVITTAGLVIMRQAEHRLQGQIVSTQTTLKQQRLSDIQNEVKDITNSLKLSVQVLSKEVLFSKLLDRLATVTPSNAVLTDLNISQVTGAIDVSALTTDYSAATQLQINLADPGNQLFSHADIVSISCISSGGGTDTHYPCTVTIRALFANNNPFLLINDGGSQ